MNKILMLIGAAGSGKSTIEQYLINMYNFKKILSNTTRPRRKGESPDSYNFVTDSEFSKHEYVESVRYNDNRYGFTKEAIDSMDIAKYGYVYILTAEGMSHIKNHLNLTHDYYKDNCITIYVKCSPETCTHRMVRRGDKADSITKRVCEDESRGMFNIPDTITDTNTYVVDGELPTSEIVYKLLDILNINKRTAL